jgi:hypothetical protein
MRTLTTLLLLTSAISLSACAGGGGGITASGISSGVGSSCPLTEVDTNPDCVTPVGGGGTTTPPVVDSDGDGVPDTGGGTDTDGGTGSGAGGNDTGLVTGNKALVMKANVLDKPTTADSALSTLSSDTTADLAATTEAILGNNKPKKLLIRTDTKSAANNNLAVAQIQDEYVYGTRDLRWLWLGHTDATIATIVSTVKDKNNKSISWDANKGSFVYTADDPGGDFNAGEAIDMKDDAMWAQFVPFMNAKDSRGNLKANGGAGANYREYRLRSNDTQNYRDEALQVWAWNDSYATEYRNGASNGEPKQEIWSFGGRKAETVRTGGKVTYTGRWVGTAKTENWIPPTGAKINPNALWMVQGNSVFSADFGANTVKGTMTAETWTADQDSNPLWTWYTPSSGTPSTITTEEPDYVFYDTKVTVDGKLVNDGTPTGVRNEIVGNAALSGGFLTGDNAVRGGLFGNDAHELTGVFHVQGGLPQPLGGSTGQTDGREGVLIINGAFHNTCTKNAAGACVVAP